MHRHAVTPFVGVWIETPRYAELKSARESHPSWVCGLKLVLVVILRRLAKVTPFVGVWIETYTSGDSLQKGKSHPSWVCGLKPSDTTR